MRFTLHSSLRLRWPLWSEPCRKWRRRWWWGARSTGSRPARPPRTCGHTAGTKWRKSQVFQSKESRLTSLIYISLASIASSFSYLNAKHQQRRVIISYSVLSDIPNNSDMVNTRLINRIWSRELLTWCHQFTKASLDLFLDKSSGKVTSNVASENY